MRTVPKFLICIAIVSVVLTGVFEIGIVQSDAAIVDVFNLNVNSENVYGKLGVITGFDFDEDFVFASDWNGDIWVFCGADDWCIGDYVSMVMYDNGTGLSIYDDIVLSAIYERVDLVQAQILNLLLNR